MTGQMVIIQRCFSDNPFLFKTFVYSRLTRFRDNRPVYAFSHSKYESEDSGDQEILKEKLRKNLNQNDKIVIWDDDEEPPEKLTVYSEPQQRHLK